MKRINKKGESNPINSYVALFISLFVIAIVVGVIYLGLNYMNKTTCQASGLNSSSFNWDGAQCINLTGGNAVTITAITKMTTVGAGIDIALGLLALVILIVIFSKVIKTAKGFQGKGGE